MAVRKLTLGTLQALVHIVTVKKKTVDGNIIAVALDDTSLFADRYAL